MNTNQAHLPMMSICGKRREITLGRVVIEMLDYPCFITLRISKKKDGLIFYPCKSTDALAVKVPDNMFDNRGARVRIISKQFVQELLMENGMDHRHALAYPAGHARGADSELHGRGYPPHPLRGDGELPDHEAVPGAAGEPAEQAVQRSGGLNGHVERTGPGVDC